MEKSAKKLTPMLCISLLSLATLPIVDTTMKIHVFYCFGTFLPPSVLQNHLYNLATVLSGRNNIYSQGTLYYHA